MKRLWVPVIAGVVALAVATAVALVVTSEPAEAPTRAGSDSAVPAAAPTAADAKWSIRARPAGIETNQTKADRARVKAARPHVVTLVKDLYDALFLHPDRLGTALSRHATVAAARQIKRAGVGFPPGAEETVLKKRAARIGIQGNRAGHAVAAVRVVSKGTIEGRPFRLAHSATLWLQRDKDGWKVIGFDFDQRRAR